MASKNILIEEEHVIKLILQFLHSRKYFKTARALEKEAGVRTFLYSENINFFRDLVLDGDWDAVREFAEPLAEIPTFEYRRFNFLVAKQEYLELLFEKCEGNLMNDKQVLRDRVLCCIQNLQKYCTYKEDYNKLYWYLSVPSLHSQPEFFDWNVDSSRMMLFKEMLQLLELFIPIGKINSASKNQILEDRLIMLLIEGSLYENCIEFCQKQAKGKMDTSNESDIKVDLFQKNLMKNTANFYSWLHGLSKESFVTPFEELRLDIEFRNMKPNRVVAEMRNNTLSRSLTFEATTQVGMSPLKERRKRFPGFSCDKMSEFDVSQSCAEFDFNRENGLEIPNGFQQDSQEVFFENKVINSSSPRTDEQMESARKTLIDQQDLVVQHLEEHKRRHQELYEQLAEHASLLKKGNDRAIDVPLESINSLEAVRKSIESIKLLSGGKENSKKHVLDDRRETPWSRDVVQRSENLDNSYQTKENPRSNKVATSNELQTCKSSSSPQDPGNVPKTPVNQCLPPGLVNLTDGSGIFNTSTPKTERQSFSAPLSASPVAMVEKIQRNENPQSEQLKKDDSQREDGKNYLNVGRPTPGIQRLQVKRAQMKRAVLNENTDKELSSSRADRQSSTVRIKLKDRIDAEETAAKNANNAEDVIGNTGGILPATDSTKFQQCEPVTISQNNDLDDLFEKVSFPKNDCVRRNEMIKRSPDIPHSSSNVITANIRNGNAIQRNATAVAFPNHIENLQFNKLAILRDSQAIRAVSFHPTGDYMAIGTNSKTLKICRSVDYHSSDRNDGEAAAELVVECQRTSIHSGSVYCVAFSENGEIIATGSNDKTIKLVRFHQDNGPVRLEDNMELMVHHGTVRDLTFIPGGSPVLVSGGAGGGLVYLSDCSTGQTISSLQGHAGNVMAVYAGDQAHLLCSGSADKNIRLWDLRTAKCIDVIGASSCVTSVCFNYNSASSLLLASADENGQCLLYDVGARRTISTFQPHELDCRSVRFSSDSQYILTGSYDACVAVTAVRYDSMDKCSESRIVARHRDKIIQCRWHPLTPCFVSTSADKTAVLWEAGI